MKRHLDKIFVFKDCRKYLIDKFGVKSAEEIWNRANEEYVKIMHAKLIRTRTVATGANSKSDI